MPKIAQISAKIGGVALAVFSLANLAPAQATTFTFGSGDDNLSTITKIVDGITLTLTGFQAQGSSVVTDANNDGIYIGNANVIDSPAINTFTVSFNTDVLLNSYGIGFEGVSGPARSFDLGSSTVNIVDPVGTYNFNNPFVLAANTLYTFVTNGFTAGNSADFSQLQSITVTDVSSPATTPEPVSLVALLGVGALGFASRKQK